MVAAENKEWLNDQYVITWFNGKAEKTIKNYKSFYPEWLEFIGMTPTEQIEKRLKDLISQDKPTKEYFEGKLVEWKVELLKQFDSESSIRARLTTVRSFFSSNRLELHLSKNDLKIETTSKIITKGWIPINEEIRVAYGLADVRNRALLLTLYHSGLSEIDVSSLNIVDFPELYETEGHYYFQKQREKTTSLVATCLSAECIRDIQLMLKDRGSPKEGSLFISAKGERLSTRYINIAMKGIFNKAFPNKKFKTKSLRDAYNSALLRAELNDEIKDLLFGHQRRGAKKHYSFDETTIREAYDKAFKFLSINSGMQYRTDIKDMDKRLKTLVDNIGQLTNELNSLKLRGTKAVHMLDTLSSGQIDPNLREYLIQVFAEIFDVDLEHPTMQELKAKKKEASE